MTDLSSCEACMSFKNNQEDLKPNSGPAGWLHNKVCVLGSEQKNHKKWIFPFSLTTPKFHQPSTCSTMQGKHDFHPSFFGLCQLILSLLHLLPIASDYIVLWNMIGWMYIVLLYTIISRVYIVMSIVSVAIQLYVPRDWPMTLDHHSTPTQCKIVGGMLLQCLHFHTSLTKSDSHVWHQTHRKAFTSHSNFLATATLHLPKGAFTIYFKLFTSFFLIPGLLHAAEEYAIHQDFSEVSSIWFFILQAVAITFEDTVIVIASCLRYK